MYTIYSKTNCLYCVKAKELLKHKRLEFTEKNIENQEYRTELLSIYPEVKTVPQIYLEDSLIGGYDSLLEHFKQTI